MPTNRTAIRVLAAAGGTLFAVTLAAGPASAKSGDVIKTGSCSASSDWKLKLGPRDSGIETEFEVDSNVVGQKWSVVITDNGATVLSAKRTTVAPSGSFTVRALLANKAGTDTVVATARNAATGETCRGSASI
jgi:hypothetical protein